METELLNKFKDVLNFLYKYNIIQNGSITELANKLTIEKTGWELEDFYDTNSQKFSADVPFILNSILPAESTKLVDFADWWFDVGEEYENNYTELLGLPAEVHSSTPQDQQANKITVECSDTKVTVTYKDLNTDKRFALRYGINAINKLAEKVNSPKRLVELVDRGDDFALYVALPVEKIKEFRSEAKQIFASDSVTNAQEEVETEILNII